MIDSHLPDIPPPPETGEVALPNGCHLYWKLDLATGGREYLSDEIGGGVQVWHTSLVDDSTLLAAIVQESTFRKREHLIAERLNRSEVKSLIEDLKASPLITGTDDPK